MKTRRALNFFDRGRRKNTWWKNDLPQMLDTPIPVIVAEIIVVLFAAWVIFWTTVFTLTLIFG